MLPVAQASSHRGCLTAPLLLYDHLSFSPIIHQRISLPITQCRPESIYIYIYCVLQQSQFSFLSFDFGSITSSMLLFIPPLPFYQTLFSLIGLLLSHYLYRHVTIGAARRRFIASKGCKPIRKWRNKDPFLGLDFLWASFKAVKEHRALELTKARFDRLGVKTAHIDILTRRFVATIEPENLKCVLASDFRNYSLSKERKKLLRPLLGDGIFTMDGDEWVLSSFVLPR